MFGRIVVSVILIPLILLLILKGEFSLFLAVEFIIAVGMFEFYRMVESKGIKIYRKMGIIAGVLIPLTYYIAQHSIYYRNEKFSYMIFTIVVIIFITRQVISGKISEALTSIAYTFFGVIYVSFLLSHIIFMKDIQNAVYLAPGELTSLFNGRYWILTTFLMVWASDSAAYFVGMAIGKHKLAPKISPKKSIEGAVAGLIAPIGVMFLVRYVLFFQDSNISVFHIIMIGLIGGIFGQIGDLGESLFKREFEIKDSGKILFGHGGILDRFDSMIFVLPLVYYYLKFMVITNIFEIVYKSIIKIWDNFSGELLSLLGMIK
jgi:phosphatidate cytidylyltransferase